ncbi:inner spore coat protein H [Paenibacillus baekrokdamisoli]|uniref:Inner spore coat protein H n=1 Tax=Paenibacillus baekrokdamisoli TaxID=1712516 RepID=A0A3G9J2E1_9BACL|nr:CotH kinase family protein [Paenibacillus baekrokdamisoli]MBB3069500.1 spore coat protein H [Paenibacillus baekrokdamisoli]BBH24926.1 inner spore coat protein H [Paenibacillus baekrokdamisoli]
MSGEGLPSRKITIQSKDLNNLQADVWSNQFAPVKLELDGISYDAQLRFRGGHTRNYPKKSYEITFGDDQTLHWNAEFDDPSMIRNALSFHFFNMIQVPSPKTQHIWLEWNGQPHGVYLEIEAVDQTFFSKRRIASRALIYAINDKANFSLLDPNTKENKATLFEGYRVMRGNGSTKTRLTRFVRRINKPVGKSHQSYLVRRLDIGLYLKWLAGAVLTGNYDGFDQNYALYEHASSGKYRIIPWDYEGTWGRNCYGRLCGSDLVEVKGYNKLTQKILAYKSCRQVYRRLLIKLLEERFTWKTIKPVILQMYQKITPAIQDDFTRKWPFDTFEHEPEVFQTYVNERRSIIYKELRNWTD